MFAALFRPDLGFVARRLNKPISVPLTRRILVATSITPNQITLIAAAFGLVGCALIASGRYAVMVAGFACQQIQSILDGCDGELARVRMQQSKLGAWLDTFVDDVLNVLITVAIGIGVARAGAGTWAAAVGIAGGAMLVASNLIIMRDMRRQKASGDLMDMVWWFSGGRKLGAVPASTPDSRPGIGSFLFQLGRRDSALFLWLRVRARRPARAGPDHGRDHRARLVRRQRRAAGRRAAAAAPKSECELTVGPCPLCLARRRTAQ